MFLQSPRVPTRFTVASTFFFTCFISYVLRTNISLIIIELVSSGCVEWSRKDQSFVIGAWYWGYLVTSLIAGFTVRKLSSKDVVGLSLFFSAILTGISPLLVQESIIPFFIARFLLGASGGFVYPSIMDLISRWAPPDEKGKFVFTLLGGNFGTVITWAVFGHVIEWLDWQSSLFLSAILTMFASGLWFYVIHDSPSLHPRISKNELEYIQDSLGDSVSKATDLDLPIYEIFTSVPFIVLLILHYGNLFGLFFLLTAIPRFISEVLKFKLTDIGLISSLPYLMRIICGYLFGHIGDYHRSIKLLDVTTARKFYCIFSHIIPGLLLGCLFYVGFSVHACIAILTLSLGFNGAVTITTLQNSQDLAPNFAGSLYGIINFFGTTSGFISPLIVTHFTQEQSTMEEWRWIFLIGSLLYIIPAIIFILFGSGEAEQFNERRRRLSSCT